MVYSSPPGFQRGSDSIFYDDSATSILNGSNTESLQLIIEELANQTGVIVEAITLTIPANTWTIIPLSNDIGVVHDFKIFLGNDEITDSVSARKSGNTFEVNSLLNLNITIIIQGTE